jgi:hypothetical protein
MFVAVHAVVRSPWREHRSRAAAVSAALVASVALLLIPVEPAGAQTAGGADISSPVPSGIDLGSLPDSLVVTNDGVSSEGGSFSYGSPAWYNNARWYSIAGVDGAYSITMTAGANWSDESRAAFELWADNGDGSYSLMRASFGTTVIAEGTFRTGNTYYFALGSNAFTDNGEATIDVAPSADAACDAGGHQRGRDRRTGYG